MPCHEVSPMTIDNFEKVPRGYAEARRTFLIGRAVRRRRL